MHKPLLRHSFALLLTLVLGACQTTSVIEEAPTTTNQVPGRLSAMLTFAKEIAPDSVAWSVGKTSGNGKLQEGDLDSLQRRVISVVVDYGTASGDTLWTDFSRWGVRVSRLGWVRGAEGNFVIRTDLIRRDTLGRSLLRLASANALVGRSKVDSLYAARLLLGDLEFSGFPDSVPGGINPRSVRRQVLLQGVASKRSVNSLADQWLLDLDAKGAHDTLVALLAAGLVSPADTAILFPLPSLRLNASLSLDSALRAGGAGLTLHGELACDSGLQMLQARILDGKGGDASGYFAPFPPKVLAGTRIRLDTASLVLQALAGTPADSYRLRLTVLDKKAKFDSFDLVFSVVVPKIARAPRIVWISPSADSTFTSKDSLFTAQVKVEDSLAVDAVWLGGISATKVGAVWQAVDTLHQWGTPVRIQARARNAAGADTVVESPKITHNAPSGEALPEVLFLDPATGLDTLAFSSTGRKVSWSFRPGAAFKSVQAVMDVGDGSPVALTVSKTDTVWSTTVLPPPTKVAALVKILVVTPSGYLVPVDTFLITRRLDQELPTIEAQAPPLTMPFDSLFSVLKWKVSDNHRVDTVWVNGTKVNPGSGGIYTYSLKLDIGVNKARVVARDSTGNLAKDSVQVIRLHSSDPPKLLRRTGTADRQIEYRSTDSVTVSWTVTDKEELDSVTIAGVRVKDSAGIYFSRRVGIGPGANNIGIVAWGKYSGKSATDTVVFTTVVVDAELRKYPIRVMPDGRVWMTTNLQQGTGSCGPLGCEVSGRMFNWAQAMGLDTSFNHKSAGYTSASTVRGVCPSGFHIPSAAEWTALFKATIPTGATDSSLALRTDTGWTGTQGTNLYGNFLPVNYLFPDIKINIVGGVAVPVITIRNGAAFWSAVEVDASDAEMEGFQMPGATRSSGSKTNGMGVRCLEDKAKIIIRPIAEKPIGTILVSPVKIQTVSELP